ELKSLRGLLLHRTQITDAGIKELKELQSLQSLALGTTAITDAGLKELKELKSLQTLWLGGTKGTREAAQELQAALPGLRTFPPRPERRESNPGRQERRATRLNPEGGFPVERVGLAGSESNATT